MENASTSGNTADTWFASQPARNMRVVIQRVKGASVAIGGHKRSSIGAGMLVLAGIEYTDEAGDVDWLAGKISRMRIFSDQAGLMNLSLAETGGEILVVSQFTLLADTKKGNRPSFVRAAPPEIAIPLYERFLVQLAKETGSLPKSGEFGADMQVSLVNDGPVTILMDSKNK